MSAPDKFSPIIQRLHRLIAECEEMRQKSAATSAETARMIAETEKRIEECIEQLGGVLNKSD